MSRKIKWTQEFNLWQGQKECLLWSCLNIYIHTHRSFTYRSVCFQGDVKYFFFLIRKVLTSYFQSYLFQGIKFYTWSPVFIRKKFFYLPKPLILVAPSLNSVVTLEMWLLVGDTVFYSTIYFDENLVPLTFRYHLLRWMRYRKAWSEKVYFLTEARDTVITDWC